MPPQHQLRLRTVGFAEPRLTTNSCSRPPWVRNSPSCCLAAAADEQLQYLNWVHPIDVLQSHLHLMKPASCHICMGAGHSRWQWQQRHWHNCLEAVLLLTTSRDVALLLWQACHLAQHQVFMPSIQRLTSPASTSSPF